QDDYFEAPPDVGSTAQRGDRFEGPSGSESGAPSLVPKQGARVNGPFPFRTEGPRILLHATETGRARSSGADQRIARTRPGAPTDFGSLGTGSGLQSVLPESDFFA